MSIAYSTNTIRRAPRQLNPSQPSLRLVVTEGISRKFLGRATMRAVIVLTFGAVAIIIAGLQLSIMIQQGSYQLAGLKGQMRDLSTTNQILDEQVRSLSSDQNLANAAASLGMVTNANPVYLRLSDGKVIGHPTVAGSGTGVQIGKNVVPNAALVATTTKAALQASTQAALAASQAAKSAAAASASAALHPAVSASTSNAAKSGAAKSQKANVAAPKLVQPAIALSASGIPVSPTH
jgi:cell division protein FtsL